MKTQRGKNGLLALAMLLAVAWIAPAALAADVATPWRKDIKKLNYVTLRGGLGMTQDMDRTVKARTAKVSFDSGWNVSAAIGRSFCDWFRAELEYTYTTADVDKVIGHFSQDTRGQGKDRHSLILVNGLIDIPNDTIITPYLGAGIGADYAVHKLTSYPVPGQDPVYSDDSDWVLAYQFMAGLAFDITPAWALDIQYRFTGSAKKNFDQTGGAYSRVELDALAVHMGQLGLRFRF